MLECINAAIKTRIYNSLSQERLHPSERLLITVEYTTYVSRYRNICDQNTNSLTMTMSVLHRMHLFCGSLGIGSKTCSKAMRLERKLLVKHISYFNTSVLPFDKCDLLFLLHFRTHGLAAILPLVVVFSGI